jgi:hypothetical protein
LNERKSILINFQKNKIIYFNNNKNKILYNNINNKNNNKYNNNNIKIFSNQKTNFIGNFLAGTKETEEIQKDKKYGREILVTLIKYIWPKDNKEIKKRVIIAGCCLFLSKVNYYF